MSDGRVAVEYFLTVTLRLAFFLYFSFLLVHVLLQRAYASATGEWHEVTEDRDAEPHAPSVDVVIPCYNEEPAVLDACCVSLAEQDYRGELRVFLVDDGSPNRAALLPIYQRHQQRPGWTVLLLSRNAGKRHAQDAAMRHVTSEIVMTVDSDTTIAPDAVRRIVAAFRDPRVVAVAGKVMVGNASHNLLTRLIDRGYWLLFERERAAQSRFGSVLCCPGPFSAYRRTVLTEVWSDYLAQKFGGVPCVTGDDLHLANLTLAKNDRYILLYAPRAVAFTQAPPTIREYVRQQLRWSRSFYRELAWMRRFLADRHPYLAFDVVTRAVLAPLLAVTVLVAVSEGAVSPSLLAHDASLVEMLLLIHAGFVIWPERDPGFLLWALIDVVLLHPVRLVALFSVANQRWGTRESVPKGSVA